ncbi:hypothetical protein BGZ72_002492, partial [Mortierella alpina]
MLLRCLPKRQPRSTGRNSAKKQGKASESTAKGSVENATDGAAAAPFLAFSPKRGKTPPTSTDSSNNHANHSSKQ